MSFVSASFAILYGVALLLRFGFYRTRPPFIVALLVLSWVFYAWHVPGYLLLIVASTLVDYSAARILSRLPASRKQARRRVLIASLAVNLGLLGWFKYAGFLAETSLRLAALLGVSLQVPAPVAETVLPIGISFYTFQSMSYTLDVYRGRLEAKKSFLEVACYIAFFPQLVAGPIVRATEFLYQLERRRKVRWRVLSEGFYLIVRGLFLKMVVADNLGRIVDAHWTAAAGAGPEGALAPAVLVFFAGQLFCDFAGYSSIARGLAYTLGFRLPVNFDAPYVAATFREFWRRWHITLSSWMRDYLYIPLGGNRRGPPRAHLNLFVVMLISGLWHGAAWTFVIWGAVHGLAVAVERLLRIDRRTSGRWVLVPWAVVVQSTWVLSMGLFRAESLSEGWRIIDNALGTVAGLGGLATPETQGDVVFGCWMLLPVALLHLRALASQSFGLPAPSAWEKALVSGAMIAALLTLYTTSRQFIYFQF